MRLTKTLPLAAVAVLALPGAAMAKDRNHDGLPDGWEKAHNLSLRLNQAHRDQDHDGLDNRAEFRHHTNPRSANTQFAGTPGEDQGNAGTVTQFQNGILTITLADGSTLKGAVNGQTEVACESQAGDNQSGDDGQGEDRASMRDHGDDNGQGDDNSPQGDPNDQNENEQGDDDGQQAAGQPSNCTIAQNDPVREADLKATSAGPVFQEVKLAK